MAKLTSARRRALPSSIFALPGRHYPLNDKSHAKNALSRASADATPAQQATIKRKVHRLYPSIHIGGKAGKMGDLYKRAS